MCYEGRQTFDSNGQVMKVELEIYIIQFEYDPNKQCKLSSTSAGEQAVPIPPYTIQFEYDSQINSVSFRQPLLVSRKFW